MTNRTARVLLDSGTAEIEVLLASFSMNEQLRSGRIQGTLVPRITPCAGEQLHTTVTEATSFLYNFPSFYGTQFKEIRMPAATNVHFAGIARLCVNRWCVNVAPVDDIEEQQAIALKGGLLYASHFVTITHEDRQEVFDIDSLLKMLKYLRAFFSFIRGAAVGLSTVRALNDHTQQKLIARWGMESISRLSSRSMLLSHINSGSDMADMFAGYFGRVSGSEGDVIMQAIDAYVNGNEVPFTLSLPLTQSALEGLTGLLEPRKGWVRLGGFRKALEGALNSRGIPLDIPPQLNHLTSFQQQFGLDNGVHSFVKARNMIVHADRRKLDPFVFLDASEIGQWYVEMLLLNLFAYRGRYHSRLIRGNVSSVVEVPWT